MFHVPLCGCQLSMESKSRESVHERLKIASVGSAIFSRSGDGGCMWLLELATASNNKTNKTRNGWMRGVDGGAMER